ncbi:MAG: methyltransferase domain-containing protein [Chlamydiales bacterium]|nr:methyltransferase domain-containing protein [Chlamydiales bacterium]
MWNVKELPSLVYLNFLVKVKYWIENLRVAKRFYRNKLFFKIDIALKLYYFFDSPFKVSKTFLQAIGEEELYTYGETPLTTLEQIIKEMKIEPDSLFLDLGSATGRTSFWIHCFTGAKVLGIEHNPRFVNNAKRIKERFHLSDVQFRRDDIRNADFSAVKGVYLYGTCFEEPFLKILGEKLENLPPGASIATVSYPIDNYTRKPIFEVVKELTLPFSWGRASVYIQKRL